MVKEDATHGFGKWSVTIAGNGAIKVKRGDCLSGYSAAIHGGNASRVHEYGRLKGGTMKRVQNVNRIYVGETLYHLPTYDAFKAASGASQGVQYKVPLFPQTSRMSCWAASMGMILGWKHNASYSDELIARNVGGLDYTTSYTKGLNPNDKYILRANGFEVEPPMCYTREGILTLLRRYGPLWVATWAPNPHIRVVTGMNRNVVWINDPGPVNRGSVYARPFSVFFGAMEELGSRELDQASPVYVAHLA